MNYFLLLHHHHKDRINFETMKDRKNRLTLERRRRERESREAFPSETLVYLGDINITFLL
jgi:hypothetical protein